MDQDCRDLVFTTEEGIADETEADADKQEDGRRRDEFDEMPIAMVNTCYLNL